jgi:hypothetical protein
VTAPDYSLALARQWLGGIKAGNIPSEFHTDRRIASLAALIDQVRQERDAAAAKRWAWRVSDEDLLEDHDWLMQTNATDCVRGVEYLADLVSDMYDAKRWLASCGTPCLDGDHDLIRADGMAQERQWWLDRLAALKAEGYAEVEVIADAILSVVRTDPDRAAATAPAPEDPK